MILHEDIFHHFLSLLIDNINQNGTCNDAEVCASIADYINMLPANTCYAHTLYEFIAEHGEDTDESYVGRDEEGEKQYIVHNKETNWHERIRKELVAIGYYKRSTTALEFSS